MNQKTKEFREQLADYFVKSLEEKQLGWKKNWITKLPENAITGKKYKGINSFYLSLKMMERENKDPRWATFKQIQDKGWKVNKGAKGVQVEYWLPYSFREKRSIPWELYRASKDKEGIGLISKIYYVFNGQDISGIPAYQEPQNREIKPGEIIAKLEENMKITVLNDGKNSAFYRPSDDSIHMPEAEKFVSQYDYDVTVLHEMSHATGAGHRLNRDLSDLFGSSGYAYEELVAEISSCFMGEHLEVQQTSSHLENHKAYVQGWIQAIKEKPETLISAIRDAGAAANYLEYHAELITVEEYQNSTKESMEAPKAELDKPVSELDQSVARKKEVEKELRKHGYIPDKNLISNIIRLDQITGKTNSLPDICQVYKNETYKDNPEARQLIKEMGREFQRQESISFQMQAAEM